MKYTHDEAYTGVVAWRPLAIICGIITGVVASLSLYASANSPNVVINDIEQVSGAGVGFGLFGVAASIASVALISSAVACQYAINKYKLDNPHEFDEQEEAPRPSNWR